jgi:hypothetical protein
MHIVTVRETLVLANVASNRLLIVNSSPSCRVLVHTYSVAIKTYCPEKSKPVCAMQYLHSNANQTRAHGVVGYHARLAHGIA